MFAPTAPLLQENIDNRFWERDAACIGLPTENAAHFFSEQLEHIVAAQKVCATCPVQQDCFQGALERKEPWGVWGGQLFANGRVQHYKRRVGRPSKTPTDQDVLQLSPFTAPAST